MIIRNFIWLLVLCCLLTACAKAPDNSPAASTNEPPRIASVDVVKANPQETSLAPGESADAVVRLQIADGYHVNANPPSFPYLKATELELTPADGISVEFITYPDPLTKKFSFAEQPLAVYEGETTVKARLKAEKSAKSGKHNLSAKLRVQACDDKVCYAPGTIDLIRSGEHQVKTFWIIMAGALRRYCAVFFVLRDNYENAFVAAVGGSSLLVSELPATVRESRWLTGR